jgi:hypothetical protein
MTALHATLRKQTPTFEFGVGVLEVLDGLGECLRLLLELRSCSLCCTRVTSQFV